MINELIWSEKFNTSSNWIPLYALWCCLSTTTWWYNTYNWWSWSTPWTYNSGWVWSRPTSSTEWATRWPVPWITSGGIGIGISFRTRIADTPVHSTPDRGVAVDRRWLNIFSSYIYLEDTAQSPTWFLVELIYVIVVHTSRSPSPPRSEIDHVVPVSVLRIEDFMLGSWGTSTWPHLSASSAWLDSCSWSQSTWIDPVVCLVYQYLGLICYLDLIVDALRDENIITLEVGYTFLPLDSIFSDLGGLIIQILLEDLLHQYDVGLRLRLHAGVEDLHTLQRLVSPFVFFNIIIQIDILPIQSDWSPILDFYNMRRDLNLPQI